MKIMKFAKIGTLRVFFTKQKHFGPLLIVIVSNNGNMTKVFHVNAIILRWRRKNPPKWPFNCFGETFYWCDEKWKKAYTINRAAIAIEPVSQKRIENVWLSRCEFVPYVFATRHISCRIYRAFSRINVQIASTLVLFLLINRNENAPKL